MTTAMFFIYCIFLFTFKLSPVRTNFDILNHTYFLYYHTMYLQDGWSALMLASENGHTRGCKVSHRSEFGSGFPIRGKL